MNDSVFHVSQNPGMPDGGDRQQRADVIKEVLQQAAIDPVVEIRMALGRAYSAVHTHQAPRQYAIAELRKLLTDPKLLKAAIGHQQRLRQIPGGRDYIGKFQLELLDEALTQDFPEDPLDAA